MKRAGPATETKAETEIGMGMGMGMVTGTTTKTKTTTTMPKMLAGRLPNATPWSDSIVLYSP